MASRRPGTPRRMTHAEMRKYAEGLGTFISPTPPPLINIFGQTFSLQKGEGGAAEEREGQRRGAEPSPPKLRAAVSQWSSGNRGDLGLGGEVGGLGGPLHESSTEVSG